MADRSRLINLDLFQGFIEFERQRIWNEQRAVMVELDALEPGTTSCDVRKQELLGRFSCLSGQMSMLIMCEQNVHLMSKDIKPPVHYIHNPVTGKCYEMRTRSTEYGKRGKVLGLWSKTDKV